MQTTRLARIAVEAEKLRWQRRARRLAVRAVLGAIAGCFAVAALITLHVLGYIALRLDFPPLAAAAIVLAVDVVLATIFGIVALRDGPDAIEREALEVRQKAVAQIGETLAMFTMVRTVGSLLGKRGVYGMTLAALTAKFLSK